MVGQGYLPVLLGNYEAFPTRKRAATQDPGLRVLYTTQTVVTLKEHSSLKIQGQGLCVRQAFTPTRRTVTSFNITLHKPGSSFL